MDAETLGRALTEAASEIGWDATKIGAEIGKSYHSALDYMNGSTMPRADAYEALRRKVPGFAERLDSYIEAARA